MKDVKVKNYIKVFAHEGGFFLLDYINCEKVKFDALFDNDYLENTKFIYDDLEYREREIFRNKIEMYRKDPNQLSLPI